MLYILFFVMWVVFNGRITLEIVIFGIGIATVMVGFMCKFMDHSIKKEIMYLRLIPLFFAFGACLLWEIIKANLSVIRTILMDEFDVEPEIVHFKTNLDDELCQVMLANAITLTPGTITVHCAKGEYFIHCLDKEMANGIESSCFVRIIARINNTKNKYRKVGNK